MKLTVLLIAVGLCANATGFAQKVTLSLRNASLERVFNEVKRQTGFSFIWDESGIKAAHPVNIEVREAPVPEVMDYCLRGQSLEYQIIGKLIVIKPQIRTTPPPENILKEIQVPPVDITLSGRVTNSGNEPLEGVSVVVKGTQTGTVTDADGRFQLSVPSVNNVELVFSFVGYASQTVKVGSRTVFDIVLQEVVSDLSDVVVVGYGTQNKVTVTGSVSSIKGEQLAATKNENPVNMLTGKLPGVRVVQKSSEPGTFNNQFDIRGMGAPLIIVDGVPRDNFTRMDPNEIESVSVLKDAAAAVYGVKGGNGVILITTKRGKEGKIELGYSFNYGIQQPLRLPKVADAIGQMTLYNEYVLTNPNTIFDPNSVHPNYTEDQIKEYQNGQKKSSDWEEVAIRRNAPQMQHNVSASGSSNILRYFFNFGYLNQQGFWKSNDLNYNKFNLRANVEAQISKRLKSELRLGAISDMTNKPYRQTFEVFKSLWMQSALTPVFANDDPSYPGTAFDAANTYVITNASQSGYQKTQDKWFQGSFALTYSLPYIEGLDIRGLYSYDYHVNNDKNFRKEFFLYNYDPITKEFTGTAAQGPSNIERSYFDRTRSLMNLSLNYTKSFGGHNIKALALYEELNDEGDNFLASRNLSLPIDQLFAGNESGQRADMSSGFNSIYKYATKSFVGRINYDYENKYLVEVSSRYDGSSRHAPKHKWGLFPGVSAGWVISKENFFKRSTGFDFVNNLKLRASYGQMGSDEEAIAYMYLAGYNYSAGGAIWDNNFINGIDFRGMPNFDITWTKITTKNIGIDVTLWDGKLALAADIFRRDRKGILGRKNLLLPGTLGAVLPQENLNADRINGYEVELTHRNKIGQLSYNIGTMLSYTITQVREFERAESGNSFDNWLHNPTNRNIGLIWGKVKEGQFQSYDEIYKSTINYGGGNKDFLPGDWKYKDWNEDGVIDDMDGIPIGVNQMPYINASLNLGASYKGFDFYALFHGSLMGYVQYVERFVNPFPWGDRNVLTIYYDRSHPVDPNANRYDPNTQWVIGNRPAMNRPLGEGTAIIKSTDYLRLKTIEIGYNFTKSTLSKIGIQNARIYVNGYNVFTITGLDYIDPEHPADSFGYLYPLNRSFNVGVNLNF